MPNFTANHAITYTYFNLFTPLHVTNVNTVYVLSHIMHQKVETFFIVQKIDFIIKYRVNFPKFRIKTFRWSFFIAGSEINFLIWAPTGEQV